ncbi:MAG: SDR family NAD(P)-dependent oxidoreductase [Glycomyces artemisiae]|uniref:SDR family NAD(P)-dependent oxidoreductase n=1 Tax=Glycomyces artemisiae TaxID=1076443 RepID=A0A850CA21_9ACTN|nr:SDR family NAD(P)-dependent oxidoreductase [Glycomyces artemisiae]
MRTYLITGGTDGMGRGLGLHFLERGDRVIAVASGEAKGRAFTEAAARLGAADRARFLRADLSTVAGMHAVTAEIESSVESLDGVVFATQRFQQRRVLTADGLEYTFALSYLSRFVIGHGLVPLLDRAEAPVVFNLGAPGGFPGRIFWDDISFEREPYKGMKAATQASRSIDLLAVDFPRRHPDTRAKYVVYNPMFVKTGMADPLPQPKRAFTNAMAALFAQRVAKAIVPMAALIDGPPAAPVTAWRRTTPLPLTGKDFDLDAADRLHRLTEAILERVEAARD